MLFRSCHAEVIQIEARDADRRSRPAAVAVEEGGQVEDTQEGEGNPNDARRGLPVVAGQVVHRCRRQAEGFGDFAFACGFAAAPGDFVYGQFGADFAFAAFVVAVKGEVAMADVPVERAGGVADTAAVVVKFVAALGLAVAAL